MIQQKILKSTPFVSYLWHRIHTISIYSVTSMARTQIAHLRWMTQTSFWVRRTLRRFKWVHTTYHYYIKVGKDNPELSPFASWPVAMINHQWLELPMSRTNFHGPKDVRAIEVQLYCCVVTSYFEDAAVIYIWCTNFWLEQILEVHLSCKQLWFPA